MKCTVTETVKNQRGMTLLEIMVVLAILGGLIGVLATQINSRFKKARTNEAKIQIAEIGKALEMFYTDCGFFPESLEGLVTAPSNCSNWGPDPYLKKLPKDPWGEPFGYTINGSTYSLKSLGDDRKEGGSGTASDISSEEL